MQFAHAIQGLTVNCNVLHGRFVKTLDSFYGIKLNPIKRRGLIKQLTLTASMQLDDKKLDNLKKKIKAKKEESEKLKNVEGSTESHDCET